MGSVFKSLGRFWNNEVKSGLWNPVGRFKRVWAPSIDQWLGSDITGDRAAARVEEQRRYLLGLSREDNAYQRAYADARAAGINPNIHGINPAASQAAGAGDVMAGRVDATQGSIGNIFGAMTSLAGLGLTQQRITNDKVIADAKLGLASKDLNIRSKAQELINDTVRHDLAIARGQTPPNVSGDDYYSYRHGPIQENPIGAVFGSIIDQINESGDTPEWLKNHPLWKAASAGIEAYRYSNGKSKAKKAKKAKGGKK